MSGLGLVVIGGHQFPIERVSLADGQIKVQFLITGPVEPFRGNVTIIGEDGTGCWQGKTWEVPGVPEGKGYSCDYYLRAATVETHDRVFSLPPFPGMR